MFTQCPQCNTNFSINDHDLTSAGGKVQCGKCGEIFNALYTLSKHPMNDSGPADRLKISSIDRLSSDNIAASYQLSEGEVTSSTAPSTTKPSAFTWGLLGLLLSLLLIAQVSHFMPGKLATGYPLLRPWLEQFCAVTHCELALRRAPDKVTITERDVRSHPTHPQALLVSLTLKNGAEFVQAYPRLALSFFDLNHRPLANRTFEADEYLPQTVDLKAGFPAGATLSIELALVDPDPRAVNFEFEFK